MEIKKGDKFICLKDIKDIDEATGYCRGISFKEGKVYVSETDGCITNECGNKYCSGPDIMMECIFEKIYTRGIDPIPDDVARQLGASVSDTFSRADGQRKFKEIVDQMYTTYVAKNHDYGNSFDKSLDKFGLVASTVRLGDKMNRIESLQGKANMVPESIRDTLLDMANYAIMTVMWLDNQKK